MIAAREVDKKMEPVKRKAVPKKKKGMRERRSQARAKESQRPFQLENRPFTSTDVHKLLNIKRVTLQDWMMRGYVVPDQKATGYGSKNVFSMENLYQIRLFANLVENGLSREAAAKRVSLLRDQWSDDPFFSPSFVSFIRLGGQYSVRFTSANTEKADGIEILVNKDADEIHTINVGRLIESVNHMVGG
jgi:hypothetical protein